MTTRAVPFHCPYCGDEDLEPYEGEPNVPGSAAGGGWYCRACARAFKLKFLGIGVKI
ncbi:Insertion element protein [Nonomuraea antimicrobica]|uniref:Insertion element protein n=1 Tax=Nonomuraea antimicrobica TaxID=561173 RepID=UPI0031ECD393